MGCCSEEGEEGRGGVRRGSEGLPACLPGPKGLPACLPACLSTYLPVHLQTLSYSLLITCLLTYLVERHAGKGDAGVPAAPVVARVAAAAAAAAAAA